MRGRSTNVALQPFAKKVRNALRCPVWDLYRWKLPELYSWAEVGVEIHDGVIRVTGVCGRSTGVASGIGGKPNSRK